MMKITQTIRKRLPRQDRRETVCSGLDMEDGNLLGDIVDRYGRDTKIVCEYDDGDIIMQLVRDTPETDEEWDARIIKTIADEETQRARRLEYHIRGMTAKDQKLLLRQLLEKHGGAR